MHRRIVKCPHHRKAYRVVAAKHNRRCPARSYVFDRLRDEAKCFLNKSGERKNIAAIYNPDPGEQMLSLFDIVESSLLRIPHSVKQRRLANRSRPETRSGSVAGSGIQTDSYYGYVGLQFGRIKTHRHPTKTGDTLIAKARQLFRRRHCAIPFPSRRIPETPAHEKPSRDGPVCLLVFRPINTLTKSEPLSAAGFPPLEKGD